MQPLHDDSSTNFEERGQEAQDQEDLDAGRLPREAQPGNSPQTLPQG